MTDERVSDAVEDILKTAKVLEALFDAALRDALQPSRCDLLYWQLNELMIRIENHASALGVAV